MAEKAYSAAASYCRFQRLYTVYRVLGEPEPGLTFQVVRCGRGEMIEILIWGRFMQDMVGYRSRKWLKRAIAAAASYGRFQRLTTVNRGLGEPEPDPTSPVVSWGCGETIEILIWGRFMQKMV